MRRSTKRILTMARLLIDFGRHILSRQMFYIDCRFQSGYVHSCVRYRTRGLVTE